MKTLPIIILILTISCTHKEPTQFKEVHTDTVIMPNTLVNQYQYGYITSGNKDSVKTLVLESFRDVDESLLFAEGKITKLQWDFIKKCKQIK